MPARDWMFQATPDDFDFDGFAASEPPTALWRVSRYGKEMDVGDRVFLWHAKGKKGSPGKAGVVGLATISGPLVEGADTSPARPFWRDPSDASLVSERIEIRFEGLAKTATIPYGDLQVDPLLKDHAIFTSRAGTNFALTPAQGARLAALWDSAGKPVGEPERIAALVASVEGRDAAWLAGIVPRTLNRCRAMISAADPSKASAYGIPAGAAEIALWDRYVAPGGLGLEALGEAFRTAYPEA